MAEKKRYDKGYKIQAVKLGREIGISKVAREGRLDLGPGAHTPDSAMSLSRSLKSSVRKRARRRRRSPD